MIKHSDGGYLVRASDGCCHSCSAVVIAIPPALRSRIVFEPGLPAQVSGLQQRSPMGTMIKVLTVYPTAWWREQGLNGYAQGTLPTVEMTADSSPPSGKPGVLASFIAANKAVQLGLQDPVARKQLILNDLVTFWRPEAAKPVDYFEINWAGTECSARWAGYYEGAIQAGLDASRTVQSLLG